MNNRVYLDANATTCVDPILMGRYMSLCQEIWGNPSSAHHEGQNAKGIFLEAKRVIREILQVPPHFDIFFFSSATEALNTLIKGTVFRTLKKGERSLSQQQTILSTEVEHAAVFECIHDLVTLPFSGVVCESDFVPVGLYGAPKYSDVVRHVEEKLPSVAAFMAANNETGVVTDELPIIAKYLSSRSIPLIVDGVAFLGKSPILFHEGISAYIFSGHKIHAPKGVAVAVVDKKLKFRPMIVGGPQESKKRAGTENVPLAVIFADALRITMQSLEETYKKLRHFQCCFENELEEVFPEIIINCRHAKERLPSTSNISFPGIHGEDLLMALDMAGVSASHGSACSSGALEPSRVLLKMGMPHSQAGSSVRFSWSRLTTEQDIKEGIRRTIQTVKSYMERK